MERRPNFAKSKAATKYPERVRSIIQRLLTDSDIPRDSLPYTDAFDAMKRAYESVMKEKIDDHRFWIMLSSIAKYGGLAKAGPRKKGSKAPLLSDNEKLEIVRLLPEGTGARDRLPYTDSFDELHRRFENLTGRRLTRHEFWRAMSQVAKNARKPRPVYEAAPIGVLTPELVHFLEENNPWWRAKPMKAHPTFQRWAFDEVVTRLRSGIAPIVAIRGSRRVGKSVLQAQLIDELLLTGKSDITKKPVDAARILSVQFDDAPALGGLSMPIQAIVRWYEENVLHRTLNEAAREGRPAYLLFDEVQNLAYWSAQLKFLADKTDARILITGSSALRIARGQDNLAGRMTTIELGPLRLWEIAGIRSIQGLSPYAPEAAVEDWRRREFWLDLISHGRKHATARDEAFRLFSERGGYPLPHVIADQSTNFVRQQIVSEVINKTIEHDPRRRKGGRPLDPALVSEVFRMVCRYAGQSVRPNRLAEELHHLLQVPITNNLVTHTIQFLTDSMLVHCIPPLEMLQKKQGHAPKLCLCDHFVRDGVLQETLPIDPEALKDCTEAVSGQAGHVIESVLGYFLHGIPGVELSWFPQRANEPEVDFVLTIGTQRIPIEVKYRRQDVSTEALKGIKSFCAKSAYSAPFGIVVTQAFDGPVDDKVIAVRASTFLLLK